MILIDFSQISLASLAQERSGKADFPIEENLVKHFILNSIRANYKKFKSQYGEMIVCCDSRSWRKDYFKYYKAGRHKGREDDKEWEIIFKCMNEIYTLLDEYSSFKVIKVWGCEADDIIAWYCNKYGVKQKDEIFGGIGTTVEDILIISGDKDFQQLQQYANVYQFSPTLKTFIKCPDPHRFQFEQFVKGDNGDGVPNILSDDDSIVTKTRQKPVMKKWMDSLYVSYLNDEKLFNETSTLERNFDRNKKLINLMELPDEINHSILKEVSKERKGNLSMFLKALIQMRMRNMIDHINDFK